MAITLLDNYDDFNFMAILLFLYFVLLGFIVIIILNATAKYKQQNLISTQPINTVQNTAYVIPLATMGSMASTGAMFF